MPLTLTRPDGTPITTWEEWTRPKMACHWKEGRSAMELARSWFGNDALSPPEELISLLHSHPRTNQIKLLKGIPELVTPLPERGNGRNHDLALIGIADHESITICIEAKADESFGNATVGDYWLSNVQKRNRGIWTRIPNRVEALLAMVDPSHTIESSPWKKIRYQLLTALCGTILQAKSDNASLAVFVVHEFQTNETSVVKQSDNHRELERFLSVVCGNCASGLVAGKLNGPFSCDGIDVIIGKITTHLQCIEPK